MAGLAKNFLKFFLGGILILYPVLIFLSMVVFDIPANHLSVFIILFALAYLAINISNEEKRKSPLAYISPAILCLIGVSCFLLSSSIILSVWPGLAGKSKDVIKLYPLLLNAAWLIVLVSSFVDPPTFVFQIASLFDKSVAAPDVRAVMLQFCKKATAVWCVFFVADSVIAYFTIFGPVVAAAGGRFSDAIWGVYNGAVTYVIMGIIFVVQFILAKRLMAKVRAQRHDN
ncbi:MAG: hypothetical protein LBC77_02180 [Spirochaetaceae bacterium]|jgi:uncharacterized membrane protein|nr:hypothetical protein [Spirochaetaceae bacterium]